VRLSAILVATVALLFAAAPSALAATARQTINELNAQRAANGIPAGITENPAWSADCAAHDNYMKLNGTLTHAELQDDPGYSAGGAFAGQNAVLAQGADWDDGNPYESAPLHLDELLAPRLDVLGSADADGFSCTTTFPGWIRPAPATPAVYTYPGNGASIYPEETVSELPFAPNTLVGLRPGAHTGPILIILVDPTAASVQCVSVNLSHATLKGPSGFVPVATVDGTSPVPGGGTLACYISPGGFIIPTRPLASHTTYHASVMVNYDGVIATRDWTFRTGGRSPDSTLTLNGHALRFSSISPASLHVSFTRATGAHARSRTIRPGHRLKLELPPGSWKACGRQRPSHGFAGYTQCLSILVSGVPTLGFGRPSTTGASVSFPLRFSPVLNGRSATLTTTGETCTAGRCAPTPGAITTSRIVIGAKSLILPLPFTGEGVQLKIATAAFQLKDAPWLAAQATSRIFVSR
jgi:hypothetical protein